MTFNYDMMIEHALRDREIAVTDRGSYVNNATRQLTRTACELARHVTEPASLAESCR